MGLYNHDVHLLARTIQEWLPQGIQSIIEGTYTPRFLKRPWRCRFFEGYLHDFAFYLVIMTYSIAFFDVINQSFH
jgi:hypothetical protein